MNFSKISEIVVEEKKSWEGKIFLTFDVDWCIDEILSYTINVVEKADISATWFITHHTKLLDRLKENPKFELAIHPNFNYLLSGDFYYGKSIQEVIDYYMNIIPDAVSARSHSMTQNTKIISLFAKAGLRYDCNCFVPLTSNITLKPWYFLDSRITRVPFFWEDDIHCLCNWDWNLHKYINKKGVNVFNFHPIHIFLNTETISRYEDSRPFHNDFKVLKQKQNTHKYGINDLINTIIINERLNYAI